MWVLLAIMAEAATPKTGGSDDRFAVIDFHGDSVLDGWMRDPLHSALEDLLAEGEPHFRSVADIYDLARMDDLNREVVRHMATLISAMPGKCRVGSDCYEGAKRLLTKYGLTDSVEMIEYLDNVAFQTHHVDVRWADASRELIVVSMTPQGGLPRAALVRYDEASPTSAPHSVVQEVVLRLFPELHAPSASVVVEQRTPYGTISEPPFLTNYPVQVSGRASEDPQLRLADLNLEWHLDDRIERPTDVVEWEKAIPEGTHTIDLTVSAGNRMDETSVSFEVREPTTVTADGPRVQVLWPSRCYRTGSEGCLRFRVDPTPQPNEEDARTYVWTQRTGPPLACPGDLLEGESCRAGPTWSMTTMPPHVFLLARRAGTYEVEVVEMVDGRPSRPVAIRVEALYTRTSAHYGANGWPAFAPIAAVTASTAGGFVGVGGEWGPAGATLRVHTLVPLTWADGAARPPAGGVGLSVQAMRLWDQVHGGRRFRSLSAVEWNPSADLYMGVRGNMFPLEGAGAELEICAGPQVGWTSWGVRIAGLYQIPLHDWDPGTPLTRFSEAATGATVELTFLGVRHEFVRDYARTDDRVEMLLRDAPQVLRPTPQPTSPVP